MSSFCNDSRLNSCMISVHYGSNKEAVPRCWALADKEKFKNGPRKAFLEFLEMCYCKSNPSDNTALTNIIITASS
jgi:hypothetical protein